ncbi:glycosyltransferase family A protein [Caulobacter sp. S45]|uniref:glycosyltransferase family 2 protein n=1 Tax=Caulobacter sp. S45 TaxID=1641861 RepID=UPI00131A8679|nr:glycosyltransferase family A protein [Caulobacter sp. S45]
MPVADVLIPAFNAASTVRQSLLSIQQQTVRDIKIIVVDDGSTDSTPQILAEIAATDPRVQVISKPNGGIVEALNIGLTFCESAIIARHDADDIARPERFALQLAYLDLYPDCLAVSGSARHIDQNGHALGTIAVMGCPSRADPNWAPVREPYLMHPFLMVRRAAMEAVGGYRYVCHAEDADLYWRLSEIGVLHNMSDILGDYRIHPDSIMSKSILNGRVSAVSSQLSGISALRRRAGRNDLSFDVCAKAVMDAATDLRRMIELVSGELDAEEVRRLMVDVAGKMLELTSYRPYELQLSDCQFINKAIKDSAARLPSLNRRQLYHQRLLAMLRLILKKDFASAYALSPINAYPRVAQYALGVGIKKIFPALGRKPAAPIWVGLSGEPL